MDNIIITPDQKRGTYERIVDTLSQQMNLSAEAFKKNFKVMPSILKMAQYLNTGLSAYSFSPRKGVDPAVPNTLLLDQNDFFALDGLGLRLGRAAYASSVYSNHGNYPLLTYPDPAYFTGNGATAGKEWESLQTLVNGSVAISVNTDTVVDGILAQELFYNPNGKAVASPIAYPDFGGNSDTSRGIFPVTPQVILDASADNAFNINLANGAKANIDGSISATTVDSGIRNILYVIAYGWKIKNLSGAGASRCVA